MGARPRRSPSALAAAVVLILLGVPFLGARFEIGDARTLPRSSEVRDVALTLADRFPARGTDPVTVIADTDPDSAEFLAWYEQLSTIARRGRARPSGPTRRRASPSSTSHPPEPHKAPKHPRSSPTSRVRSRASTPRSAGSPPS